MRVTNEIKNIIKRKLGAIEQAKTRKLSKEFNEKYKKELFFIKVEYTKLSKLEEKIKKEIELTFKNEESVGISVSNSYNKDSRYKVIINGNYSRTQGIVDDRYWKILTELTLTKGNAELAKLINGLTKELETVKK